MEIQAQPMELDEIAFKTSFNGQEISNYASKLIQMIRLEMFNSGDGLLFTTNGYKSWCH